MFRLLASLVSGTNPVARAETVLGADTRVLSYLLDTAWASRGRAPALGGAATPTPIGVAAAAATPRRGSITWDHLIYAFMIEQTHAFEIMRRVASEMLHGERLGMPLSPVTHAWLQTTEELFFRDASPPPFTLASRIRPDLAASRRNAYYRMFGMDLNHGGPGGAYHYEKPAAANREFVATFEEFLRSVWRAIENVTNTSGPRETDPDAIANLALRLQNMLNARRGGPAGANLARDEFVHVTTLAWFHLTVESDNAVVRDLRAGGPSPEERLRLIGERVGVPAHAKSHNYFQLATAISALLTEIELGLYSTAAGAQSLYALPTAPPPATNPIRDNVLRVINHWSQAAGRDMKARGVMVSPRVQVAAPLAAQIPVGVALPAANGGNGRAPVVAST